MEKVFPIFPSWCLMSSLFRCTRRRGHAGEEKNTRYGGETNMGEREKKGRYWTGRPLFLLLFSLSSYIARCIYIYI